MIAHRLLANLEALGRRVQLMEKWSELLLNYNHKLIKELSDRPVVPYDIFRKKTSKKPWDHLAAGRLALIARITSNHKKYSIPTKNALIDAIKAGI